MTNSMLSSTMGPVISSVVSPSLTQATALKQSLLDYVLDAEGELAIALEQFSALNLARSKELDMKQRDLVVDRFLIEGQVEQQSPLDLFLQNESASVLSESDRHLVKQWQRSFVGLFAIVQPLQDDSLEVMNWLTAKHYRIRFDPELLESISLKPGGILLTQIAPLNTQEWIFFSPLIPLGKLGKPKLAVAIGNFKQNYKEHLYSDAPDLLEEAWRSVERYHQYFVDFFGSDELTLPGWQMNKKFAELQEFLTQKQLEAAGIDSSRSLQQMMDEADISQEEVVAAIDEMGVDSRIATEILDRQNKLKMKIPQIDLPGHLKSAEQVTVLAHPRWGQTFLSTYSQFKALLEAALETSEWQSIPNAEKLVQQYLEDPAIDVSIWQRLAQQYPTALLTVLQTVLQKEEFNLEQDLSVLLQSFNKPLEPELPEIASVPAHLHQLFQEALMEVNATKSKPKGSSQKKTQKAQSAGFQRR